MRPCKVCGQGIPTGWIGEIKDGQHTWYHRECFARRHEADGVAVEPETNAERVAKKIAEHEAAGTLADYPLAQRLAELRGEVYRKPS
jgi:hypothetical protein